MQNEPIVIAILLGTTREGRESDKVARYVVDFAAQLPGVEVVLVDPRELTLPGDGNNPDAHDSTYADLTARADAFYIVTPEYNHGYPGSLKRMLDSEYQNYRHKPVGVAGVSNGNWGGVRVCEALLPVMHRLGMPVIHSEVYFPHVQDLFDEHGQLLPEHQAVYAKNLQAAFDELVWYARTLKSGKQHKEG
jgi:NAD(P)H-dependent FMN reductase